MPVIEVRTKKLDYFRASYLCISNCENSSDVLIVSDGGCTDVSNTSRVLVFPAGQSRRFVSSSDVVLFQLLEKSSVGRPFLHQLFQVLSDPNRPTKADFLHNDLLILITNIEMASKALLGFNAAAAIGAVVLYLGGARVVLDSNSGEVQPLVDIVQSSPPQAAPSSDGKRSNYTCTHSEMKPKFLSYDPIMVYIENFISPYETEHLKKLA